MTGDAARRRSAQQGTGTRRMIVARRCPTTPVGVLERSEQVYRFAYLETVLRIDGFRPLVGFPDVQRRYQRENLFHLFAQRAMSPRRPDYLRYVAELGLTPEEHEPWELLARSHGTREVDRLQLLPVPEVIGGTVVHPFLVHGTRNAPGSPEERERTIRGLTVGERLQLVAEPNNEANPAAVLVTTEDGAVLGWVPDLLLRDLHRVTVRADVETRVLRANGPDAPAHLRVLAELAASGLGDFEFFRGSEWRTVPESLGQ
ncbi:HIRAN domain-containing protein [Isoptericola rhizosphaerae]|uniref:HIRAN domain-containing protein n=1 Tax=Isoptericola rhizosphaerae TaxID=3377837 RepID=UPI00383B6D28